MRSRHIKASGYEGGGKGAPFEGGQGGRPLRQRAAYQRQSETGAQRDPALYGARGKS